MHAGNGKGWIRDRHDGRSDCLGSHEQKEVDISLGRQLGRRRDSVGAKEAIRGIGEYARFRLNVYMAAVGRIRDRQDGRRE
jgi:hypothetical protein